jgi:hypothetical protein
MCALIAQRSIGTILPWRPTKHARRNVNSTTFSDDPPTADAQQSAIRPLTISAVRHRAASNNGVQLQPHRAATYVAMDSGGR